MSDQVTPPEEVQKAMSQLCDKLGPVEAAKKLKMGRDSVLRIAGGYPVRAATIALARERLGLTPKKVDS